jgi:hypothetical protein
MRDDKTERMIERGCRSSNYQEAFIWREVAVIYRTHDGDIGPVLRALSSIVVFARDAKLKLTRPEIW